MTMFAALCVIWGIPYLLIRVAVKELSPAFLVFARTGIGAALLLPIAARRRELRVLFPAWRPLLLFTVVEIAVPWLLLSRAEERLASSLTGLLVAAVPLVAAAVTAATGSTHRPEGRSWVGLLIGIFGVAALVGLDFGRVGLVPLLEVFVVVLGYTTGPMVLSRSLSDLPSLGVIAASLTVTAVVYAPFAAFELPKHVRADVVLSVVGLGVVCTALAFLIFFALIAEVGPVRATVITYVNPAVAAVLGVALLSERFTVGMAIGFALVLGGSVLATGSRTARDRGAPLVEPAPAR
ncbi:MAG TPA: DMT family transporter [Solirubrobacteraceae bacterium]|nr:DMT family transporter [Solirubrobacteraceae bacterium]